MLHKAWNSKGEMPFCVPRSSIIFQGHTVQNITDFDPNWAFPDYRPVAAFKSLRFALLFSRTHRPKNRWFESNLRKITRPVAAIKSLRFALFSHDNIMHLSGPAQQDNAVMSYEFVILSETVLIMSHMMSSMLPPYSIDSSLNTLFNSNTLMHSWGPQHSDPAVMMYCEFCLKSLWSQLYNDEQQHYIYTTWILPKYIVRQSL